jgi:hypothetical protein
MRWATVGVVVVVAAVLALIIRPPIKEPGVAHELIAMQRAIDETGVQFFGSGRPNIGDISDALQNKLDDADAVDAKNSVRLGRILDAHGWPTEKEVGEEAEQAALNVVGRSRDVALKERALDLMAKAGIKRNERTARLIDMVAVIKGEPQTYGTQWTCQNGYAVPLTPVADPDRALELRRQVGLPAFDKLATEFCRDGTPTSEGGYIIRRP